MRESPQLMKRKCFDVINNAVHVEPERSVSDSRSSRSSFRKEALIQVARALGSYLVSSTFWSQKSVIDKEQGVREVKCCYWHVGMCPGNTFYFWEQRWVFKFEKTHAPCLALALCLEQVDRQKSYLECLLGQDHLNKSRRADFWTYCAGVTVENGEKRPRRERASGDCQRGLGFEVKF